MTRNETREQERAAHRRALVLAEAAELARSNAAVTAYFNEVEARAVETLLALPPQADLERLKLAVVAKTIRELRAFLEDARDGGVYAQEMLARMDQEESTR